MISNLKSLSITSKIYLTYSFPIFCTIWKCLLQDLGDLGVCDEMTNKTIHVPFYLFKNVTCIISVM